MCITYSRVCINRVRFSILLVVSSTWLLINFSCPCSRLRIWSRETGSADLSRVGTLILHTQTESIKLLIWCLLIWPCHLAERARRSFCLLCKKRSSEFLCLWHDGDMTWLRWLWGEISWNRNFFQLLFGANGLGNVPLGVLRPRQNSVHPHDQKRYESTWEASKQCTVLPEDCVKKRYKA